MHKFYILSITIMFSNLFCDAFLNRALNDFVITVFYNLWITRNSRNMLLSVAKDVYLNNGSKTTHYTSQLFYSPSIILFFWNSPNKASGLLFIFVCVRMGHAYFFNNVIRILGPSTVFFSCRMPEKSTRKAGLEVCGWPLRPNPEMKSTFKLKLTST